MLLRTSISALVCAFTLTCVSSAMANNVILSSPEVSGQDAANGTTKIQADISWENSWYDNENHDGVWLFAKYRVAANGGDGLWHHASLSTTGHTPLPGMTFEQYGNTGVLLRRAVNGSGNISTGTIQLQWNYALDEKNHTPLTYIQESDMVEVRLFAIEMVHVSEGAFQLGDASTTPLGNFNKGGNVTQTFAISDSTGPITLGGTAPENLRASGNQVFADDFTAAVTQTLPETFPNGYHSFYIMKYEVSQEQYVDFLNTLTRQQQQLHVGADISGPTVTNVYVMRNTANLVSNEGNLGRNGIRCATNVGLDPITFYCDLDGDGIGNEINDGQTKAVNHVSIPDVLAYMDWAGLRPMTELEYEKACRGTGAPVVQETAGGTSVVDAYYDGRSGVYHTEGTEGTPYESPKNDTINTVWPRVNANGMNYFPTRVGTFARPDSTRANSSGSFYGAMDLTSNVGEFVVSVGREAGRTFTAALGDGQLDSNGTANVPEWPETGYGWRAIGEGDGFLQIKGSVSGRHIINLSSTTSRYVATGIRGVLSEPVN